MAVRSLAQFGDPLSGGRQYDLSLYCITESSRSVSLRAPYPMYYGVVDGQTRISPEEGQARVLQAGDSLVVPPLQTIRAEFPNGDQTPVEWLVLKINREKVRSALDNVETDPLSAGSSWAAHEFPVCHLQARDGIRRTLDDASRLFRDDPPHRDALLDLNVQQLILYLSETPAASLLLEGRTRQSAEGGLAAAIQYIQNHLDRHISIDELVERACMSKSTFYRHFSDEFDMSPLEYITEQRVARARHLLTTSDMTVADVSHALGFSSTSYFIDMFNEHVGQTPKQYQLRAGDPSSSEVEAV